MARKTRTATRTARHERWVEGEEIVVVGVIGTKRLMHSLDDGTLRHITAFVYVSPTNEFVEFLGDADMYLARADEPETMRMLLAFNKSDKARIVGRFGLMPPLVERFKGVIVVSSATLIERGDGFTMISKEEEAALKAQR
jgi:hypothetical protein